MEKKESSLKLLSKAGVAMAVIPLLTRLEELNGVKDEKAAFTLIDEVVDTFITDLEAFGFILIPVKDKQAILDGGFEKVEQTRKALGLSYSEPAELDPSQPIN